MNKLFVTLVLAATAILAQGKMVSDDPGPQAGSSQDETGKKQIKDPAEYNAYIAAFQTQDPKQKATAMMAFLQQYPNTIMKQEALEQARGAYQASGDVVKLEEISRLMLKDNPNDIQSLALITAIERNRGTAPAAAEAKADAEKGLQLLPSWKKPEGIQEADFEKVKSQMNVVFNGAAGFGALQAHDYPTARKYYLKALEGVQLDAGNMQDVYQLSIAELEASPIEVNGFWYAAKAINLAGGNAAAVQSISGYAKAKYKKYHGNTDGWDQIVAAASAQNTPAGDFVTSIKPAPTPCDIAVDAVKQNDPGGLSFSDWEFVLSHAPCSPANKEAADKVWQAILAKEKNSEGTEVKLKLPVQVISATKDSIQAAITEENQHDKKADLTVILEKPTLRPPAPGSTVDVVGVLTAYTPEPFMFTMEKGDLPAATPTKTPVRRPPPRRRPQ